MTGEHGIYASAVYHEKAKAIIIKMVNANNKANDVITELAGSRKASQACTLTVMKGNSMANPMHIKPEDVAVNWKEKCSYDVGPPFVFCA